MVICTLAGQKQGNFLLQEPVTTAPPALGKGSETHLTELGEHSISQDNLKKVMDKQDSFLSVCTYTQTSVCADAHVPLCVLRCRSIIQREVNSKLMMPISARHNQQFGSIQKCFFLWV